MKLRKFSLALACVLAMAVSVSFLVRSNQARSFQGEAYAIKSATIVTVTGAIIQKGTVVIRNGLIAAVGADVAVPADVRVIDGTGLTVYPGLFDAHSSYGVRQAEAPAGAGGGRGGGPNADPAAILARLSAAPSNEGLLPEVTVVDQLQVTADTFDQQRAAGITTALTAPRSGIFQGQSALINLGDVAGEKLILKAPVALNIGFGGGRGFGGGYPGSPMGVFAFLRQSLLDAQHYREEWGRYNKNPRGMARPQVNKSSAALQPVINGEMPVIFNVSSVREIQRAVGLAEEFNLKYMLSGAYQSYQIVDYLKSKKATVLLSLSFPQKPAGLDDPESEPLRTLRDRAEAPKAAAMLQKAGVKFAFTSGTLTRPSDYLVNAARAIESGLPKEEALKALTIYPAQIFGVSEQLGSIEKGKIANLIVTSGDIFARDTKVKHIFVDGKYFVAKAPEQAQRPGGTFAGGGGPGGGRRGGQGGAPGGAPGNTPPPSEGTGSDASGIATGSWALTVNSPRGEMKMTANLQQNGGSVSGEITLPFGTVPITKGLINGNEIELEYTITTPNGQTMNGTLKGKIEGNTISGQMGQIGAPGRNSDFTGAKTPKE